MNVKFLTIIASGIGLVLATASLLHVGEAVAALFDARPLLRRMFSIVLVLGGFAVFQLTEKLAR